MRDIVLTAIVFGSLPFIFKQPRIGMLMWIWLSVMNPHRLTFGFAYSFPFVAMVAGVTLLSAMMSREIRKPPPSTMLVMLGLFAAWTGVSTFFAIHQPESFDVWKGLLKTLIVAFLIPMLFYKKEHLRPLLWIIALSIAYFGTKGGMWTLLTGGGERVYGPTGSYIQENNALAVAVIMTVPLLRYLQLTSPDWRVRWALMGMMGFSTVAAIGSYSRGALLAVTAMLAFLWAKGKNKLPFMLLGILAVPLLLSFMPAKWFQRMDTLKEYDQEGSATARLNSWATMFNIAKDRPLTGAGFAASSQPIYDRYSPEKWRKPQVAHSIYFQALGEHGFVGLALYLMVYIAMWRTASRIIRLTKDRPKLVWARDLSAMMQVTLIGFAVGGAFLSLVNYDVPYYLVGIMVALRGIVEQELREEAAVPVDQAPANPIGGGNRLVGSAGEG